jgi:hypothetical protein
MTREEILNMPAGREMDALIAEKVIDPDWVKLKNLCPHYSTDIAAAWELVEKMKYFTLYRGDGYWECEYSGQYLESIDAETAPLAICRAALLAVIESDGGNE